MEAYRKLVDELEKAIALRYGLPGWSETEHRLHKEADRIAAATEAVRVVGWTEEEMHNVLRIPFEPLSEDPLVAVYGGTPWEPWPPQISAARFLTELQLLTAQASHAIAPSISGH
ncbi:MAG TPA: hypothetical protein VKV77_04705 [Methylovirgula sp.]|nr:hypothetical protein [Methylovirgula sp.]